MLVKACHTAIISAAARSTLQKKTSDFGVAHSTAMAVCITEAEKSLGILLRNIILDIVLLALVR